MLNVTPAAATKNGIKPFDCADDAMVWISHNAIGPVECFVWDARFVIGGDNSTGGWIYA